MYQDIEDRMPDDPDRKKKGETNKWDVLETLAQGVSMALILAVIFAFIILMRIT